MALRIGGPMPQIDAASQPAMLPEQAGPEMLMMEEMMPEVQDPSADAGRVSQESARYFGPEYRCAGCVHYLEGGGDQSSCDIVAGPITPDGVCSLFTPDAEELGSDGKELSEDVSLGEDEGLEELQ